jgi:MoxR-like ATPase
MSIDKTLIEENTNIIKRSAEEEFQNELEQIKLIDRFKKPENWIISPQMVINYIMGGKLENGFVVSPKYFGDRRLIEIAVATLATDRALLLLGVPGTGKSFVSEHITAAVSGDSSFLIQGTAGLGEESIRYNWNYARLIAQGPSKEAMVPSPMLKAMQLGKICRLEELTRISSEVQDTLITILSEKVLPIPELNTNVRAINGFNVIATANDRDKGVNDLSAALRRRFNTVILPLPRTENEEIQIVVEKTAKIAKYLALDDIPSSITQIRNLITIFRELREGIVDKKTKIKSPSGTLSPAEAISIVNQGMTMSAYIGNNRLQERDLAASLHGAIVQDREKDLIVWSEYLETVMKTRPEFEKLYLESKKLI